MKVVLGLTLVLILAGCGSMRIDVSVLNPEVVEQEIDRRLIHDTLSEVLGQTEADVKAMVLEVENDHFRFLQEIAAEYRAEARVRSSDQRALLEGLAQSMEKNFQINYGHYYDEVTQQLLAAKTAVTDLNNRMSKASADTKPSLQEELARQLRIRDHLLRSFYQRVREEKGAQLESLTGPRLERAKAALDLSMRTLTSFIAGQGLVEDPYAHAVASAPDESWAKEFNNVYGRGRFGNLNMAVKMQELGDFTIKGLTFDPSDVARVASKVTTQALLIATQIAGVPIQTNVQSSSNPPTGSSLAASSKAMAETQQARILEQAKIQSHEDGLASLAGAILREWKSLEDDQQRRAGIDAIKASFTANRARLRMEDPSQVTPPPPAGDDEVQSENEGDEPDKGEEEPEPPAGATKKF